MQKLISVFFCFFFLVYSQILAQKIGKDKEEKDVNFDYGKIPQSDLDMKIYPLDSSAEAVILTAKGETSFDFTGSRPDVIRRTFRRIKFFKKSAFSQFGKFEMTSSTRSGSIDLNFIKAAVIQPDGKRVELTKKDFIEEKTSSERKSKKFTFPNLTEGCIVEYEFEKTYKTLAKLPDWLFQDNIPVRHSELWLNLSDYLEYVSSIKGYQKIKKSTFGYNYLYGSSTQRVKLYADSIPALKSEPYISTMEDYLSQVEFYLKRINYPSGSSEDIMSTWNKVAKVFIEDKNLGEQYLNRSNYGDVWKAVKPLVSEAKSDDEKIQIIYNFLNQNVNWIEDDYGIFSPESLDESFKKKKANSGELNLMMIACLKELGIKSFPMLVSTRSNGKPITVYSLADQFNHLACYIDRGEKSIIADVGSTLRPLGIPRIETLNEQGWILDKENPRWISIVAPISTTSVLTNFKLDSVGALKGSISASYKGYAAVIERNKEEDKHEKIKKEMALAYPEINIDSIISQNTDNLSESFKRNTYCSIQNAATVANDLIYVKPTLKTAFDENPFKLPNREYPVEFSYPIKEQYISNLEIPMEYQVDEMPKSAKIILPNNGGSFTYVSSVKDKTIQLVVKITITQLFFSAQEYSIVKEFFNQIASKSTEQIVLKKK